MEHRGKADMVYHYNRWLSSYRLEPGDTITIVIYVSHIHVHVWSAALKRLVAFAGHGLTPMLPTVALSLLKSLVPGGSPKWRSRQRPRLAEVADLWWYHQKPTSHLIPRVTEMQLFLPKVNQGWRTGEVNGFCNTGDSKTPLQLFRFVLVSIFILYIVQ